MRGSNNKQTVFITAVCTPYGRQRAGWLVDSLRAFGGSLSQNPVWLFEVDRQAECHRLAQDGLTVIPVEVPEVIRPAIFSGKVYACAQAEALQLSYAENNATAAASAAAEVTAQSEIAANAPLAVQASKRMMRMGWNETFPDHVHHVYLQLLPLAQSEDTKEGMRAFAERREPRFEGR